MTCCWSLWPSTSEQAVGQAAGGWLWLLGRPAEAWLGRHASEMPYLLEPLEPVCAGYHACAPLRGAGNQHPARQSRLPCLPCSLKVS